MTAGTFVDTEEAVKAWARATAGITAKAPGGVFLSLPRGESGQAILELNRVGGAPEGGDAPLDLALVQFNCWGGDRKAASDLATAVVTAAESLQDGTVMGPARGHSASVTLGPLWSPDPDSNRARYVVDVLFRLTST